MVTINTSHNDQKIYCWTWFSNWAIFPISWVLLTSEWMWCGIGYLTNQNLRERKAKDGAEETEVHQNSPTKEEIPHNDKVERLQFTQFTTPHHDFRSYHSHQLFQPNYTQHTPWHPVTDRFENQAYRTEDATRRIRVDIPEFHGKLDPHAFQDWVTSLEDYFEWLNMPSNQMVNFVKMKLKGQARVW